MADQPVHPIPHNSQPAGKSIIICCDGTGNQFGNANSNVLKLYTALNLDDETRQIGYYHPGVGTMGDPRAQGWFEEKWSVLIGLAFGAGFRANVLDAYSYLMEVYEEGDRIYLLGFSRGAYTVRALAGLLHGYGLLRRGNEGHLPYAWRLFVKEVAKQRDLLKTRRPANFQHTIPHDYAFAETFSRTVRLRFVGVWDTVSSVGWITKPLRLLDLAQNPIIDVARHAVSVDEKRAFFRDNLYGPPLGEQDITQLWFPGVHSDVGGSYPRDEADPANTTLRWMFGELAANGALLCLDRIALVLGTPIGQPDLDQLYCPPAAPFHELHNSLTPAWWILQFLPQEHYDKDDAQINWRVPFWTPRELPIDALVHWSAVQRLDDLATQEPPYKPQNLIRKWLHPLPPGSIPTTADLTNCYIYKPENRHPPTALQTLKRRLIVFVMAVIDILLATLLLRGTVWLLHRAAIFALWFILLTYHWLCVFWAAVGHDILAAYHHLIH
jgi:Uncharacterized alpha/beta hydrolase domain (DUF2235)